ncbi:MAG: hypothetical protein PF638_01755 [Candidatus Delongbacteria bacterium]|nr:hypothetical protein [Candidatus Delongbacteria bacterium]
MKKLVMFILSVMILMSCSEDSITNPINKDGSIFLFNGLGDVGTLSVIDNDKNISNDVTNVGKFPNHIYEYEDILYVVNSGNNNIQMINSSSNESIGSIEFAEYSNPMRSVVCNGKVYATNSGTNEIFVYSLESDSLITIPIPEIMVPSESINGGTDAIYTDGHFVFVGIKNYTFDINWNAVYDLEYLIIINSDSDEIELATEVGYNISDILIDHEGDLHVLCSGNRNDVNGLVKVYSDSKVNKNSLEEILLGSQPSSLIINSEGMIYVGIAGFNLDWTGFGGIMKYNSVTNEVVNNSENLFYTSETSGIMDLAIDGYDNLYVPIFDNNELIIFENDVIDTILTTGNGPQGMVFVGE